jgi:hypothetical protein
MASMNMRIVVFIAIAFTFPFMVCCQQNNSTPTVNSQHQGPSTDTTITKAPSQPDYIIFGRFCGECGGECATMYKIDFGQNKLFADHTDSYWSREEKPLVFQTAILDTAKINLARKIWNNTPDFIATYKDRIKTFGCPDCTDGCGIYLEISNQGVLRRFRIDAQTEQISGEIRAYAELLNETIDKMAR